MNIFAYLSRSARLLAVIACLVVVGSVSALSIPRTSVLRVTDDGMTETGLCCHGWDLHVRVYEPEHLLPIVVTWSADYQATAPFYSGVSINGGPCVFNGPMIFSPYMPEDGLTYTTRTVQWLFMPGDYKLVKGANDITLCGGAVFSDSDVLILGFSTLTAHLEF